VPSFELKKTTTLNILSILRKQENGNYIPSNVPPGVDIDFRELQCGQQEFAGQW